ncbi:hypothetical protein L3X38_041581 [Prunus dulcis]|uniref:Reverse transcriptase domain-containing protein n=1 Tax=Prunus dulcis TaxID=3755 RepID=A0AAD4UTH7_PRUDU|nr:hypothetical protein L3X38_041581 [Prunus dulcis]
MRAEVDKLSSIGFIKEVDYPTWLANVVMVRKPRKGWCMCVDYTNLNRACPKDIFPLPRPALTSWLTPQLATPSLASWMLTLGTTRSSCTLTTKPTPLITDRGLYCYKVMSFGLKNVGATYQRLVNSLFAPLIGNTMEVYVDDMLVKICTADPHISNLEKILGFMISQRGIEANLEKIQAILDMKIPKTVKDIQSLTRHVAALTSELNEYMSRASLLSTPEPGDILMIYLSVSAIAVSSVLIRPKENAEHPVHYVSKALQDAEVWYPNIEKLAFALVVSARRLRLYFQAHIIHF